MSYSITALLTACALSFTCATAQERQAGTPTFTSGTTFVQVPVIVQRSGKHVGDLTKQSFELRQDGKVQPITTFEEIRRSAAKPSTSEGAGANEIAIETPPQITIIALDMVDTPNLDRAYFNREFEKYLAGTPKLQGLVGLVQIHREGIRVVKGFTTDPHALLVALTKDSTSQKTVHNEPNEFVRQLSDGAIQDSENYGTTDNDLYNTLLLRSADETMTRFQDRSSRIDVQLTIQQLAQALKGIPGRKSLLLVGSGFKFIDSNFVLKSISGGFGGTAPQYSIENGGETLNQAAYTWKLLNDANVAVYPIDTRRTVNTAFQTMDTSGGNTPSNLSFEQNRQADQDILATFKTISAATGGKPCFYRTDLSNCVREAVDDDHDYYLLGFYADKAKIQPGWHKIDVKLNQKATVRYREGFIIAKLTGDAARKTDIGLALNSPFAYTELSFKAAFEPLTEMNDKSARFTLEIPPGAILPDESTGHLDFDVVAIARSSGGKEAARVVQHVDRKISPENIAEIKKIGIDYSNRLDLAPGEYGVWFVVRDNISGRTGSAVVPLKIP